MDEEESDHMVEIEPDDVEEKINVVRRFPGMEGKEEQVIKLPGAAGENEELFYDYKTGKVVKASEVAIVKEEVNPDILRQQINIGIGAFIIALVGILAACLICKTQKQQKPKLRIRESFR